MTFTTVPLFFCGFSLDPSTCPRSAEQHLLSSELEAKSRKELQALAKANGIKANLSSEKIINSLIEMQ